MSARLRVLILLAAPLVAYGTAPFSGFVWDDHKVIEHGRLIGSLRNLPALYSHDAMFNSDGGRFAASAAIDTYRPLTLTTFFIEHALWGKRAAGYHVVSVLVHTACVLALYLVALALGVSRGAAFFAALLFAVHPAIGEAVHWINGRSDPLCVLFLLLALLAWLRGRAVACALLFVCATLCKETAFLLAPPVLLLSRKRQASGGLVWPWLLGGVLGVALRLLALRHVAVAASGGHLAYALVRLPLLWLDGLRSLALPAAQMPPSLYERYAAPSLPRLIAGVVLISTLVVFAWRRWRRDDPFPAWALASALCALAPIALLTADEGWTGWGRYLYPAMPVFALAVGAAVIDRGLPKLRPVMRRVALFACVAIVLLCAAQTLAQGRDFADDRAFASAIAADHPQSSLGWSELASVELNAGHSARALELAERACELAPRNHLHWSRAAGALMQLGRRPRAYAAAARALALDPNDANARYISAIGRLELHDEAAAAPLLLDALLADPAQDGPWQTLEQALTHLGPSSLFAATVRQLIEQPRYAPLAARVRPKL